MNYFNILQRNAAALSGKDNLIYQNQDNQMKKRRQEQIEQS